VSSSEPLLRIEGLSSSWGPTPVLRSVDLRVEGGEYFVLLGPNGSGKTTLLRLIAGLERPTRGQIRLEGRDLAGVPTHRRGIGLMFQDPALFTHRSVYENIAYAPLLQRRPRREVEAEVDGLVRLLRLEGFEDRSPDSLSGGERQRVALARTLAARPRLVLLDEPFAAIDVELRGALRAEFRRVLRGLGTAAIHVTHDREEGLFLGDRVGLLFEGRLHRIGPPSDVYDRPGTERAARFLGYNVTGPAGARRAVDPRDVRLRREPPGVPMVVEATGPVGRERVTLLATPEGERFEARGSAATEGGSPGTRLFASWERSTPLEPDGETPSEPGRTGNG
jgi:ABC-type Fe3+/spermidine/putrescine transport system ATPase subunit